MIMGFLKCSTLGSNVAVEWLALLYLGSAWFKSWPGGRLRLLRFSYFSQYFQANDEIVLYFRLGYECFLQFLSNALFARSSQSIGKQTTNK